MDSFPRFLQGPTRSESVSPTAVLWVEIVEFHAGSGFGHHGSNRVTPFGIVGGRSVRFRCRFIPINLDEDKPGRIIGFLHQVKPGDPRFPDTVLRILDRGLDKGWHGFGFYLNIDMHD